MKFIYKGIGLISILFIVASCSFSKKQTMNKAEANDSCKIEVVVLDPGHFHASLLQKDALAVINDTIRITAFRRGLGGGKPDRLRERPNPPKEKRTNTLKY